jgi:serine/threonine-protein kinase RsbW
VPVLAQRRFPGHAPAVGQARRFVTCVLGDDWPGLDEVLVLVSEVASNAVKHSASGDGGTFEVAVSAEGSSVRVEVADQGGASEPRVTDEDTCIDVLTGCRGLRIVEMLAAKWGHAGDELGRVVWFEYVTTAPTAPPLFPGPQSNEPRSARPLQPSKGRTGHV